MKKLTDILVEEEILDCFTIHPHLGHCVMFTGPKSPPKLPNIGLPSFSGPIHIKSPSLSYGFKAFEKTSNAINPSDYNYKTPSQLLAPKIGSPSPPITPKTPTSWKGTIFEPSPWEPTKNYGLNGPGLARSLNPGLVERYRPPHEHIPADNLGLHDHFEKHSVFSDRYTEPIEKIHRKLK